MLNKLVLHFFTLISITNQRIIFLSLILLLPTFAADTWQKLELPTTIKTTQTITVIPSGPPPLS